MEFQVLIKTQGEIAGWLRETIMKLDNSPWEAGN